MATVFTQSKSNGGSASTVNVTFDSDNAAGASIVAFGFTEGSSPSTSISDSQSNSYTLLETANVGGHTLAVWIATGIKAGANTVTWASGQSFTLLAVAEYPPTIVFQATPTDQFTTAANISGSISIGPLTTTVPKELLISGYGAASNSQTLTPGSGWELVTEFSTSDTIAMMDQLVSSTGSYSATGTIAGGSPCEAFFITLKLAGGAAAAQPAVAIIQ